MLPSYEFPHGERKAVAYHGLITPLSPIVHGEIPPEKEKKDDNVLAFRRMPFLIKSGNGGDPTVDLVPVVSGNALRGIMRDILSQHLFETLGVDPAGVNPFVFHFLTAGGVSPRGSKDGGAENIALRREVRRLFPLVRLFGGVLVAQHLPGTLISGIAVPLVRGLEYVTGHDGVVGVRDLNGGVATVRYMRKDDTAWGPAEKITQLTKEAKKGQGEGTEERGAQMPYGVQIYPAGVPLAQSFLLLEADPVVLSMFDLAVSEFCGMGIVGGASRAGHGRVKAEYRAVDVDGNPVPRDGGELYVRWLVDNKQAILSMMTDTIPKYVSKNVKNGGKKGQNDGADVAGDRNGEETGEEEE